MIRKNTKKKMKNNIYKGLYTAIAAVLVAGGITTFSLLGSNPSTQQSDVDVANTTKSTTSTTRHTTTRKQETTVTTSTTVPVTEDRFIENVPYKSEYILPIGTAIVKDYSDSNLVYSKTTNDYRTHNGVDFAANKGDAVKAVISGEVKKVYEDPLWGLVVEIDHGNKLIARYCGLNKVSVQKGTIVEQGSTIGEAGTVPIESKDKNHIHFEMLIDGKYVDPLAVMGKA